MAKRTTAEKRKFHIELVKQMVILSTSGFGLVAALAWNNVIQEVVNNYVKKFLPQGSSLISLLLYAIVVTILAVLITVQLTNLSQNLQAEK